MGRKLLSLFLVVFFLIPSFSHAETYYVGNLNTGKFHYANCSSVSRMKESNKIYLTYAEAVDGGYSPCKRCRPYGTYISSYQSNAAPKKSGHRTKQSKGTTKTNKVVVSSKTLNFNGNSAKVNTVIKNGLSLMEVRSFANAIGASISLEGGAIRVYSNNSTRSLYLYPNSANARTWSMGGSKDVVLPMKVQNINGRTYIPARSLVEELGYSISYDGNSYSIGGGKAHESEVNQEPYIPPIKNEKNTSLPQTNYNNLDMYYIKYKYKEKTAEILSINDNENFLIEIHDFAKLCGLESRVDEENGIHMGVVVQSMEKYKNGQKTPAALFMEGSAEYLYYDLQSHENKYLLAQTPARMVGNLFFAPSVELVTTLGFELEYDKNDNSILIKNS